MRYTGTINYCGVDFEVQYDYYPEEKEVRYYADGSGYPGCPESFEFISITIGGVDVMELCEEHDLFEKLEDKIRSRRDDY